MNPQERQTTFSLASIYAFRMLGLFMILPIFSLYTEHLAGATPTLIGLALGIYGLTQGILQLPFGMISDRLGRKPVILVGLILFIIGSVIAAMSHSIYGIIIGRAIQGAGAIGSTLIALLADNTEDENRLKAMSFIGMTIGLSFIVAMILGPILNGLIGLAGLFWFTAVLAIIGIIMLLCFVPTPKQQLLHRDSEPVLNQFKKILSSTELLRLDFGIFSLHAILTALFMVIPSILTNSIGISINQQWIVYLPVLILACIAMLPFVIIAEAKRLLKPIFIGAVSLLTLTQFLLWSLPSKLMVLGLLLWLFFTAFTLLEGILPSLVSKIVPAGSKGTAMGIYSSAQFLGIFAGGLMGGFIFKHFGLNSIFLFCSCLGLTWTLVAATMKNPPYLSSKIVAISGLKNAAAIAALQKQLLMITGVKDALVANEEQVAYLKVDKKHFNPEDLNPVLQAHTSSRSK